MEKMLISFKCFEDMHFYSELPLLLLKKNNNLGFFLQLPFLGPLYGAEQLKHL